MHIETVDYQADDAAISLQRSLRDTGFAVLANHPIAPDRLAQSGGWQAQRSKCRARNVATK